MSFFAQLKGFFSDDLYVQVWENRIKVTASRDVIAYDQEPLLAVETKKDGARDVAIYIGHELVMQDLNFDSIKRSRQEY